MLLNGNKPGISLARFIVMNLLLLALMITAFIYW